MESYNSQKPTSRSFDPESEDYDYTSALEADMSPEAGGANKGHWGSVRASTRDEKTKHRLPDASYLMLKGKSHPTWDKAVVGESERGFKIIKRGARYWSVPREWKE
jgi:hypothetical protein